MYAQRVARTQVVYHHVVGRILIHFGCLGGLFALLGFLGLLALGGCGCGGGGQCLGAEAEDYGRLRVASHLIAGNFGKLGYLAIGRGYDDQRILGHVLGFFLLNLGVARLGIGGLYQRHHMGLVGRYLWPVAPRYDRGVARLVVSYVEMTVAILWVYFPGGNLTKGRQGRGSYALPAIVHRVGKRFLLTERRLPAGCQ